MRKIFPGLILTLPFALGVNAQIVAPKPDIGTANIQFKLLTAASWRGDPSMGARFGASNREVILSELIDSTGKGYCIWSNMRANGPTDPGDCSWVNGDLQVSQVVRTHNIVSGSEIEVMQDLNKRTSRGYLDFGPDARIVAAIHGDMKNEFSFYSLDANYKSAHLSSVHVSPNVAYTTGVFSPDETLYCLLTAGARTVFVIDIRKGRVIQLTGDDVVTSANFSSDSKVLTAAFADGTVMLWSVPQGALIRSLDSQARGLVWATFTPQYGSIFAISSNYKLLKWNVSTGSIVSSRQLEFSGRSVFSSSPDGSLLVGLQPGWGLQVWDLQAGTLLNTLWMSKGVQGDWSPYSICNVRFSADGRLLLASGSSFTTSVNLLRIWRIDRD